MACPEAAFGWGVPLTDAPVGWSPHPSIRQLMADGSPLLGPEPEGTEEYWQHLAVVVTGYNGHPRSALAVYLKRSLASTADSTGDVLLETLAGPGASAGPTAAERAVFTRYLDEIGFTGDRKVRLLLTAQEV